MTVPKDIVPRTPITADDLRALNDLIGSEVDMAEPQGVVTDSAGIPTWALAPTVSTGQLTGATFTADEVRLAGLTPADIPNITVIN